jgi:hypothetical protein
VNRTFEIKSLNWFVVQVLHDSIILAIFVILVLIESLVEINLY